MSEMLLDAQNIRVSYGIRQVLDVTRFTLYDGERVGLIGENGAGKSTLLKVLAGELTPSEGHVRRFAPIAVISQLGDTDADTAQMDARLKSEFSAQEKHIGLSGGERTRRRITNALSQNARVLLADEPTVDLDEAGVQTLEKYLLDFRGAIVLISHDRTLLSRVCTRICALTDGKTTEFPGTYTAYLAEKELRLQFARDEYNAYRAEEARIRKMIQAKTELASQKQHLPSRMGNSEARLHKREVTAVQGKIHQVRHGFESRLDRLEKKERPREDVSIRITLGEHGGVTSRTFLAADRLYLKIGDKTLIQNGRCTAPARTRTALIGPNGCGKTTFMRHIVALGAGIRLSPGVRIGYFGQDHAEVLDLDRTVLENAMRDSVFPVSDVRTVLARLNINENDIEKPVSVLSGGERAKTALARLLVSDVNFLLLDEPTNHLDIASLEALEDVLSSYAGTVLFVSHDRTFVEKVATRLIFIQNRSFTTFEGTMAEYREAEERKKQTADENERNMRITSLEMRLAALSARLSAPMKGDKPDELNAEYFRVADELRALKASRSHT